MRKCGGDGRLKYEVELSGVFTRPGCGGNGGRAEGSRHVIARRPTLDALQPSSSFTLNRNRCYEALALGCPDVCYPLTSPFSRRAFSLVSAFSSRAHAPCKGNSTYLWHLVTLNTRRVSFCPTGANAYLSFLNS